jgi:hypothetical protein
VANTLNSFRNGAVGFIDWLGVSWFRRDCICSDKTERQRNCCEQSHQRGTVRGPPVKDDFGKLPADKRCKETAEKNKTAKDAEKNRQPRGGRRLQQDNPDGDTHCCRSVDSGRGLHKTDNPGKNVWSYETDKTLYNQQ